MRRADLVALMLALAFAFCLQCRKILDVDIFWQVRAGQMVLDEGRPPAVDSFTYAHAGEPVPAVGWLAQGAFAQAQRWGGWGLARGLNALVFAAAFAVAGLAATRRGAAPFGAGTAMTLGFLVGVTSGDVRPQSFGLLGLAVLLALATSGRSLPIKLAGAAPVALAWQNAHPSLALGVVALSALTFAAWFDWLRDRTRPKPWDLIGLLLLAALAQCVTPMGVDVFAASRDNAEVARDWLEEREWLHPWDARVRASVGVFWVALGLTVVVMFKIRSAVRSSELALFLALTALSLSAARFALVWGVGMVPVWAVWIDRARPASMFSWEGRSRLPARVYVPVSSLGVMLAFGLPACLGGPVLGDRLPVEGVRRLSAALPGGRIYNFREWGGLLILEGHPRWRVALDGRLYLFRDRAAWREYADAASGRVPLAELVRRHRPDAFFLKPDAQRGLVLLLRGSSDWREVFRDERCDVFVRDRRRRETNPREHRKKIGTEIE